MPKESIAQIRMDTDVKEAVEKIYRDLGTTFAEAVRIFAVQSIREKGFPFTPKGYYASSGSTRGMLSEKASDYLRSREEGAFKKAMVSKHE